MYFTSVDSNKRRNYERASFLIIQIQLESTVSEFAALMQKKRKKRKKYSVMMFLLKECSDVSVLVTMKLRCRQSVSVLS